MYYHVVCRGNRREALFRENEDYEVFLRILEGIYQNMKFEIPAYCLMTNHFHILIRTKEQPLSKLMSLLNKRYAVYFNNRYRLTGHVFEKRYYCQQVDDDKGVLEVSRYIHRNPHEAKMVSKMEQYRWSSFRFYTQTKSLPPEYLQLFSILGYFSGTEQQQRSEYQKYVEN